MSRQGVMLCYQFDTRRFQSYGKPVIIQPKLEGDRCRAVISQGGEVQLLSSGAKCRESVPHINATLGHQSLQGLELDGELYIHGRPHEYIRSIVSRTVSRHPSYREIEYWVFDIINDRPQIDRIQQLDELPLNGPVRKVEYYLARNEKELAECYSLFLEMGFEGIIVRDPHAPYIRKKSTRIMKLKPREQGTFKCIGSFEECDIQGNPKGRLGGLILTIKGLEFRVGTGFDSAQRAQLWEQRDKLPGQMVLIKYQALTERGVPKMASFGRFV